MTNQIKQALVNLIQASEVYAASQLSATDVRCGIQQPITVQEGENLNKALAEAYEALEIPDRLELQTDELLNALYACLGWIDAVPKDAPLPTMPTLNRAWIDSVIDETEEELWGRL